MPLSGREVAAAPLSARGVSGEAGQAPTLAKLLQEHGSQVPYYTIYGEQHGRKPFKDKSVYASVKPYQEWSTRPACQTETDLREQRRRERRADPSFDLDGDGVVGPRDFFVAKHFAKEKEHRLNSTERKQAKEALADKEWLGKFSFGHDQAGARRPYPVVQIRGKVITVNNISDLNDVFPPHWNAHVIPEHATASEMREERRAVRANTENFRAEEHFRKNPFMVPEPFHKPEGYVDNPLVASIRTRSESVKAETRRRVGLLPTSMPISDRDAASVGMGYTEHPAVSTKTQLDSNRKRECLLEAELAQEKAEKNSVPARVRRTMRDCANYERCRPDPNAMTLSKLMHQRKVQFIEHNLATCGHPQPSLEKFSEQSAPWWSLQKDYAPEPQAGALQELRRPKELTSNVTEKPWLGQQTMGTLSSLMQEASNFPQPPLPRDGMPLQYDEVNGRSKPRWTQEYTPPGLAAQEPRLFETIKQARTLAEDNEPLYKFSSFEVIRKEGAKKEAAAKQKEQAAVDVKQAFKLSSMAKTAAAAAAAAAPAGQGAPPSASTESATSKDVVDAAEDASQRSLEQKQQQQQEEEEVSKMQPVRLYRRFPESRGEQAAMSDRLSGRASGGRGGEGRSQDHSARQRAIANHNTLAPTAAAPTPSARPTPAGGDITDATQPLPASERIASKASAAAVVEEVAPRFAVRTGGFEVADKIKRVFSKETSRSTLASRLPAGDPADLRISQQDSKLEPEAASD